MKTKEEIKELIDFAKENDLASIEIEGVKFSLNPNAVIPSSYVEEMKAEEMVKPLSPFEDLSEEDIRYWATPYFDILQAEKEAAKNQRELDDSLRS